MKEKTLLPVAVIALLLLWVGTLGLWAVEAQKTVDDSGPSVSGNQESIEWKLVTTWPKGLPGPWIGTGKFCAACGRDEQRSIDGSCLRCGRGGTAI
jgi:hypothetical protein